jgi:hypothetical protein
MRQVKKQTVETALKRQCIQLLRQFGGYSLPIPGGAYGVPGAPDRIVFYQGTVYATEFKSPGKNLGPKQIEIRDRIEATGCKYLVIRELREFVEALGLPVMGLW